MAKNPKRRKFRRYIKGAVDESMSLATLASSTLLGQDFDEVVNERTYASSMRCTHSFTRFTKGLDDGPVMVGVAHGDYSDSEIEAWIENAGSWNEGDLVQQEVAKRKIRKIGVFDTPIDATASQTLNDGKPITTKLGWILLQGETLKQWAYNMGASNLETTSPRYMVQGHVNLWPQ